MTTSYSGARTAREDLADVAPRPRSPEPTGTARPRVRLPWGSILTVAFAVAAVTTGFASVIGEGGWFGAPLAMIVVIVGVGSFTLWLRGPPWVVLLAQFGAGTVAMVALFAADAPVGIVPTPTAITSVRAVLHVGLDDIARFAPPVPPTQGIVSLTTLGVGVVTMCVFVAVVALRLPLLGAAALGGLYLVPVVTLDEGAPWWSFALFGASLLALVVVDTRERVRSWGPSLARSSDQARLGSASLLGPGWRLGGIALVAAVLIPPLIPGLTVPFLGGRGSNGVATSPVDGPKIALDPFVSLRRNLVQGPEQVVFTYEGPPTYLRSTIADVFDGEGFVPSQFSLAGSAPLEGTDLTPPALQPEVSRTPRNYRFVSVGLADKFLPLPAPVAAATIDGLGNDLWRWDAGNEVAYSVASNTDNRQWSATALEIAPTAALLESFAPEVTEDRERQRQTLVGSLPPLIVSLARSVTEGYRTPYEQMLAIQWFFRNEFRYSTDVRGTVSADQITAFLTERVGYCQQFAASMALMARVLGLQSRVAVGFSTGSADNGLGHTVTNRDAHAWPEVYFAKVGWVRFEPTPRSGADGGTVAIPPYASRRDFVRAQEQRPSAAPAPAAPPAAATAQEQARARAEAANRSSARRVEALGLLAVGLALACVPLVVRSTRRRRRLGIVGAGAAEAAWEELRDTVLDVGRSWSAADTPRQTVAHLVRYERLGHDAGAALSRLAGDVERSRYAPAQPAARDRRNDLRLIRDRLVGTERLRRWKVRLWPRSVWVAWRGRRGEG